MDVVSTDLNDFIEEHTTLVQSVLEQLELCDTQNLNHLDNFIDQYQQLTTQMQNYEKAMSSSLALEQKSGETFG